MKTSVLQLFSAAMAGLFMASGAARGACVGDEYVAGEWIFEPVADSPGWALNSGTDGDMGNLGLTGGAAFSTNVPPVNCDCGHSLFLPGANGVAGAVSINDYDPLAGEEKFSILAWVRRDSADGANLSARIFSDADSTALTNTTAGIEFRFSESPGNLALRINGREVATSVGGIAPTNGEWHHVAVVFDGTRPSTNQATRNVHFYVDGIQRGTGSVLQNVVPATNYAPVVIGNASAVRTAANLLAGNVDDVLVMPGWAPEASGNGNANAAIQCFMNSVDDIFPPTITAPADVEAEAGECLAPVAVVLGNASAWDDCGVMLVTNDAPAVFPVGVTAVTWTAWDAAGNTATATQTVTVVPSRVGDCDGDGLADYEEIVEKGTDWTCGDTDGDGWWDGEEVAADTDPLDRWDAPGCLANGVVINEVLYDPEGADAGKEWVELYCAARWPVCLAGFALEGTLSSAPSGLTRLCELPADLWMEPGTHWLVGGTNAERAPDQVAGFELVNRSGGSGDKGGGVFLLATNGAIADALLYSYPNTFGLDTNRFGWVDAEHQPAYANRRGESVARRWPGWDTDSVSDWVATSNRTPHVSTDLVDSDGDGVWDGDELTGNLNPSGHEPTDYLAADSDGDGLDDWAEVAAGTDPWNRDTDGDGMEDGVEALEAGSDPLSADFDGTADVVWSAAGSAFGASEGDWEKLGPWACCTGPGGTVEYAMAVATGGVYALVVEGAAYDGAGGARRFALQASVDGVLVGQATLAVTNGTGTARWMLPWVSGGEEHTVGIRWRWQGKDSGAFRILGVRAESLGGPDEDRNGVADWLDHRQDQLLAKSGWATNSWVSPVRLEGRGLAAFEGLSVASGSAATNDWESAPVLHRGLVDAWWAVAWLSPTGATEVAVSGDGGTAEVSGSVVWEEFDLLHPGTNALALQAGDAVRWNLHPDGAGPGAVSIWADGECAWESAGNEAWTAVFTNTGTFGVWGAWSDGAGGTAHSATVEVTVAEASFAGEPSVWTGRRRTWRCPGIGSNVWVEFEAGVDAVRTDTSSGAEFTLGMERAESRTAVARLGEGGPPMASTRVHGFTAYSSTDFPRDIYFYGDGSHREATVLLADSAEPLPEGVEILVETVGTGIFVEINGTLTTHSSIAREEWQGGQVVYWVEADSWSAICNSLWVVQDGALVGNR